MQEYEQKKCMKVGVAAVTPRSARGPVVWHSTRGGGFAKTVAIVLGNTMIIRLFDTSTMATIAIMAIVYLRLVPAALSQNVTTQENVSQPRPRFAFDPQEEEGPHLSSDFEWWYHFGFLREKGTAEYRYAFVSSFQRNKKGRYLFYCLSDLKSGENYHSAVVDRSLVLGGWRFFLPEGHKFMSNAVASPDSPPTHPWLSYGDNRLQKKNSSYEAHFNNQQFRLHLELTIDGPPMPVLGTGLTGVEKREDQHYYSYPRLSALGILAMGDQEVQVEGQFWYDHQWGEAASNTLMSWCWWGLQLDNGQNLAVFSLQNMFTGEMVQKGLTLHHADGKTEVGRDLVFTPKRDWNGKGGRTYSVEWEVKSRERNLTIKIRPLGDDHEIPVLLYGRIWEGPCIVEVHYGDGTRTNGRGFQELIGQGG
jgi:predicted secreted hydrolase